MELRVAVIRDLITQQFVFRSSLPCANSHNIMMEVPTAAAAFRYNSRRRQTTEVGLRFATFCTIQSTC